MKILFTTSLTGKKFYLNNYKEIVEVLEKGGHKVISNHILKTTRSEIEKESSRERQEYHKKLHHWINQSDLVVVEVSYPSTGVGYILTYALEKGKPVLALHVEEKIPITLMSEPSDKLILASYSLNDLPKILPGLVKEAKENMDVRFNFFISPRIGCYLDWIAKKKKVPRAVYLRRLIEEDMKKSKEYKG